MNDVERCSYLVRHVLHELRLLFAGLTCQQSGLFQFLGTLFGFLFRLFCISDVLANATAHLAETVLQLTYQVGTFAVRQCFLIVTVAYLP